MAQDKPTDAINWGIPIHMLEPRALPDAPQIIAQRYLIGQARILITHDPQPDGTFLWHLSISCVDRNPSWREMVTARYRLLPFVEEMAMYLPPLNEYVNCHPFTFHWHEAPRDNSGRTNQRPTILRVSRVGKSGQQTTDGAE